MYNVKSYIMADIVLTSTVMWAIIALQNLIKATKTKPPSDFSVLRAYSRYFVG